MTDSFDANYLDPPGTSVVHASEGGRISQVGLESFRISAPGESVPINVPLYRAISMDHVVDGWARDIASVGGLALFAAYRDGKASIVTALYSLYPAITVLLAVPIFDEKIAGMTWGAIVLALVAAVMLSFETPAAAAPVAETAVSEAGVR